MRRILAVGGLGCASAAAAAGLSDEGLRRSVQFWANVSRVVTSAIHRNTRLFVSTKLSDTPIARCIVSTTICSACAFTSVLAIEADGGVYQVGPVYAHYRGVQFVNDLGLISDARADTLYNELHGLYSNHIRDLTYRMRGFYLKNAQLMSTQDGFVPPQYMVTRSAGAMPYRRSIWHNEPAGSAFSRGGHPRHRPQPKVARA